MSAGSIAWFFDAWIFGRSNRDGSDGLPRRRLPPDQASGEPAHPKVADIGGHPVAELIAQLKTGDRHAFAILYDTLFPTLWRIAVFRTRDTEAARDIVHDVFLSIWIRRDALKPDLDLRVYCAAAVRNQTRDRQGHARVVTAAETAVLQHQLDSPGIGQALPLSDAALETAELQRIYQQALTDLDDRERTAALLRWEEGFSFEQIAQVLGVTKMGARHVLLRAQRKVQARLAEYRS